MSIRLSVLIPSFSYVDGMARILSCFNNNIPDELEILISDDSPDEQVNCLVDEFKFYCQGKLQYRRNRPSLGAVANWNSLLDQASGEYLLLLHHDEYPLSVKFVNKILCKLIKHSEMDVFVMQCILVSSSGDVVRPHLPGILRKFVYNKLPEYLFKRNVIGPTSCLIVRRSLYPRFDERLKWLVDVDAYYRLRQLTSKWCMLNDLQIGSIHGRNDSITASIRDELKELDNSERVYLHNKHPAAARWLSPERYRMVNAIESTLWVMMRIITRLMNRVAKFPRQQTDQFFNTVDIDYK
jgi:glycosyltransferase involved in cell wall biosynthesis